MGVFFQFLASCILARIEFQLDNFITELQGIIKFESYLTFLKGQYTLITSRVYSTRTHNRMDFAERKRFKVQNLNCNFFGLSDRAWRNISIFYELCIELRRFPLNSVSTKQLGICVLLTFSSNLIRQSIVLYLHQVKQGC